MNRNLAILVYTGLNDATSVYLKKFFKYPTNLHGHNTRSAKGKKLPVPQKRNMWEIRLLKASYLH